MVSLSPVSKVSYRSERNVIASDKGSLQSALDGYRSANANKIPILIETGETTTTEATRITACFRTSAGGLRVTPPKNNCFIDLAALAKGGFLLSASSVDSASNDNVVGGTGLYSWTILANGETTAFEKDSSARLVLGTR